MRIVEVGGVGSAVDVQAFRIVESVFDDRIQEGGNLGFAVILVGVLQQVKYHILPEILCVDGVLREAVSHIEDVVLVFG